MSSYDVSRVDRDIELAITALKKGAYLLKYGRRGKPKFCPFRLANDESVLIWFSGKEEKNLKLTHVSRIISGQRTPIFQRYPRPEKEYQSFSLIYHERSLDLICKDKEEAEVWFSGLKALISRGYQHKWSTESRSDGISSGSNSPRTYTRRGSPLNLPFGSGDNMQKDGPDHICLHSPYESPPRSGLDKPFSDVMYTVPSKAFFPSDSASGSVHSRSSGGSDGTHGQMKGKGVEGFRVSLSSAVSSSTQGSGHDDGDALGDVFIWGEGTGDRFMGCGPHRNDSSPGVKDSLVPKALESAVVLDVRNIACGGRHAALVTKQGDIFSWGEGSRGRLGHGIDSDVLHPKLIDALSDKCIELVACGEYHSCAVTLSGDLYTWGGGHFGPLGHGYEVGPWFPKRVNWPLEGIHVSSVSCGPWHMAVVTSAGQLFTFGDGNFGVLGHGDRGSVPKPREVESLKGLRTVRAACGVWHTAAVVEDMIDSSMSSNCSSYKLFTWGDGREGQLGHGDQESKLVPTCVEALVELNFCQVGCGDSMTVALTTSGHVYTIGSQAYGQLGNAQADGKLPSRVEGNLSKSFVEEIACGAYHVAVLTSRTEVYTWGKGANGRLGHGDAEDRKFPTLVEALKDKQVKSISCGTNFTAAVCLHKCVSGVDHSVCSGCHLQFKFKRKRHNCYNCGLVFCHSCSSKKSLRASMSPNPNKPYRVCDNCFNKLKKASETDTLSQSPMTRRGSNNHAINGTLEQDEKLEIRSRLHLASFSSMDSLKQGDSRSKKNKKLEFNSNRVYPIPNGNSQLGGLNIAKSFNPVFGSSKKFFSVSVPGSRTVSRATSPVSRHVSPSRSTTPTPTLGGLTPRLDDRKMTNHRLIEEVIKLRAQVDSLTRKEQFQEVELERTAKQLKEAIAIAGDETAKCKAAKEVIKSLTAQLKEIAEMLPVGSIGNVKPPPLNLISLPSSPNDTANGSTDRVNVKINSQEQESNGFNNLLLSNAQHHKDSQFTEAVVKNGNRKKESDAQNDKNEWVEQDNPGVYITLTSLPGGLKDLRRVRFSRKRFSQKQAEQWWAENQARVYERYDVCTVEKSSIGVGSKD